MKIAVLAWGSLHWDRRELGLDGDFKPNGPRLPVEFCRVSGDGRLTLVIDQTVGTHCTTYSALSAIANLEKARKNLQEREGIDHLNGVGFVDFASGTESHRAMERHPKAVESVKVWAAANGYEAAIWTALACNFHEPAKANEPFSVEAAIRYLETRDAKSFDAALTYIRRAPAEVKTPLRAAVNTRWAEV